MSGQRTLKAAPATAEQPQRTRDVANPAFDFRGPWFSTATAAAYLQISTAAAFRKWIKRRGLHVLYRGRRVLVAKADLDRAIGAGHRKAS